MDKFNKQFNSGSIDKAFNEVDSSAAADMPDSHSTIIRHNKEATKVNYNGT